MTELELYHYGVKGQKWSVRKNESITNKNKEKRHLGIDEKGRINLISGKTTTQAKKKFAVRKGNKIQRDATKASLKKLQNIKIKDLEKRYGELEDSMEYGKKADSNNRKIQAEMDRVENEIRRLKKTNK